MGIDVSASGARPPDPAIGDADAGCTAVMGFAVAAGAADRGDEHQDIGVGRDDGGMGIARPSPKMSREAALRPPRDDRISTDLRGR